MRNTYLICVHTQRWRWYPYRFPRGTIHEHFSKVVSWDEAHITWCEGCSMRATVQAILSRDGEPIRFYHREAGEAIITAPPS